MLHAQIDQLLDATSRRSGDDLIAVNDALRDIIDTMARENRPVPSDLRAAAAAVEAELVEAQFDNMPV